MHSKLHRSSIVLVALVLLSGLTAFAAPCPLSTTNPSVTICTPTNGATVSSPVHIVAGTTSTSSVKSMKIYVDNVLAYSVAANQLDTQLTMATGKHYVVVQAWNTAGQVFKTSINITVSSATAGPCPLSSTNPSVTICAPVNGATVASPVRFTAGTTSSNPVTGMKIYVDNLLQYSVTASSLDTSLSLAAGNHFVVVKAWNSAGVSFKSSINITVSATPPTGPCPLNQTSPSVTICTPANNSTLDSPVHLVAGTTSSTSVTSIKVFVDNIVSFTVLNSATVDTSLAMTAGPHSIMVQATNSGGQTFQQTISVTVNPPADITRLKHVMFFLQENRSYDNYFGRMGAYRAMNGYPAIEDIPLDKAMPDVSGNPVTPFHFQTECHENLSPAWNETHYAIDNGLMDYFMKSTTSIPSTIDPDGTRAVGYYDWTDLPYYYELALQFAMSDRFFSSVQANTIPNRMYLFAATSFGHIKPDPPPSGGWTQPTIFDALDKAGVSWRYYYQDNSVYLAEWSTWQRDSGKVYPISSYYTDIQNEATLPSVIFIERAAATGLDEHPANNIQQGAANSKKILDALMASQSWASSAMFFTFDESGGLFDHVPPVAMTASDNIQPMFFSGALPGDFAQSGLRVPFIAISPYVKPHYVSHTNMDLTAVLKFIEKRFNVPSLTARDASQADLSELFDFSTPTLLTPPPLPSQPTTGVCDFNLEKAPGH